MARPQPSTEPAMPPAGRLVLIGAIAGAHGVRGEVRVKSFTAEPDAIAAYGPLCDEAGTRTFRLKARGQVRGMLIARLDGVADRDAAEALKGTRLYVPRSALPKTKGEEFYVGDLEGLRAEAPDGALIGRVRSVANYGAGDVVEIVRAGAADLLVAFTQRTVPVVDIAGGRIVVDAPAETEVDAEAGEAAP